MWLQYNGVENIFGYVWTFLLQVRRGSREQQEHGGDERCWGGGRGGGGCGSGGAPAAGGTPPRHASTGNTTTTPPPTTTTTRPLATLQDILQFDMDTDQALSRIATANRTCSIWVGISDHLNNQGKVVGYSNQLVNIYNDRNFPGE